VFYSTALKASQTRLLQEIAKKKTAGLDKKKRVAKLCDSLQVTVPWK